jgi:hypothetical protein
MTIHSRQANGHAAGPAGPTRRDYDAGSVTVEMAALVLPIAVAIVIFAVFCARLAGTRLDLNATAATAARAASLARTPQAARDAATRAAEADLAGHQRTCDPLVVTVDTSDFRRGGQIAVTVTCTMMTSDLTGLGLPGRLRGSSTAHAVVDTWRDVSHGGGP